MGHKAPVTVSITKKKRSFLAYYPTPTSTDTSLEERILVPLPLPLPNPSLPLIINPNNKNNNNSSNVLTQHISHSVKHLHHPHQPAHGSRNLKANKTMILSLLYNMTFEVPFSHTETELRNAPKT
jgi:hypothetical protein